MAACASAMPRSVMHNFLVPHQHGRLPRQRREEVGRGMDGERDVKTRMPHDPQLSSVAALTNCEIEE